MDFKKVEFTSEMMKKVKQAKSAEEILKLAEEYEISLSEDDVKELRLFFGDGELSDEELAMVSGGKGKPKRPDPIYHVGQRVEAYHLGETRPGTITLVEYVDYQGAWYDTIEFDAGMIQDFPESWIKPL